VDDLSDLRSHPREALRTPSLSCLAEKDPLEEWAQSRLVRSNAIHPPAMSDPLRGNATADGELVSVACETPAHDSVGHCGPVD
jgi:hypothetical protein